MKNHVEGRRARASGRIDRLEESLLALVVILNSPKDIIALSKDGRDEGGEGEERDDAHGGQATKPSLQEILHLLGDEHTADRMRNEKANRAKYAKQAYRVPCSGRRPAERPGVL